MKYTTAREFIIATSLYEYSVEHYNEQRDLAQLTLQGQALSAHAMLMESNNLTDYAKEILMETVETSGLPSTVFTESAEMDVLYKSFKEGAIKFWSGICEHFMKALDAVKGWFARRIASMKKYRDKLRGSTKDVEATAEAIKEFIDQTDAEKSDAGGHEDALKYPNGKSDRLGLDMPSPEEIRKVIMRAKEFFTSGGIVPASVNIPADNTCVTLSQSQMSAIANLTGLAKDDVKYLNQLLQTAYGDGEYHTLYMTEFEEKLTSILGNFMDGYEAFQKSLDANGRKAHRKEAVSKFNAVLTNLHKFGDKDSYSGKRGLPCTDYIQKLDELINKMNETKSQFAEIEKRVNEFLSQGNYRADGSYVGKSNITDALGVMKKANMALMNANTNLMNKSEWISGQAKTVQEIMTQLNKCMGGYLQLEG